MAKQINTPATTASSKGTVTQVIGEVKVISASGETRVLQVGDKINIGDTIQTGANGAVAIAFEGAGQMSLGRSDSLSVTAELLANILKPAASAADDAAKIQELIAQGADPTQVAAASAAGAGEGENGGHSAVVLDTPNSRVGIETGFPTEGISVSGFNVLVDPPSSDPALEVLNTPPVATNDNSTGADDDALTTREDNALIITPATLLANDVDADGDTLTIISVQAAVNGTVALVNGNVVFTPNPNYNGPASFTYTVSDGKGGVATATVNINVTPVGEPDVTVTDENGLALGDNSIVENSEQAVSGTFSLSADEGISQINIAGVVITLAQLNALGTTPLTITTDLGSLTLTGFNATTGVVSYSYSVESGAQNHSAGDNSIVDSFTIVLTDSIGQTSSDTLDILITDTAPVARNDQREMSEDAFNASDNPQPTFFIGEGDNYNESKPNLVQITGNVIENGASGDVADSKGADAVGVSQVQNANGQSDNTSDGSGNFVIDGKYGHLILNQDGSYTYTLFTKAEADAARNNNEGEGGNTADDYIFQGYDAIQSLAASKTTFGEDESRQTTPADTVSEVFTYTLSDNDGDNSNATLSITISGSNDTPVITTQKGQDQGEVTEAGHLDDGTIVTGSPSATGTLSASDVDHGASLNWSGNTTGSYGSFAITNAGVWTYTLDNGLANSLAEGVSTSESFTATVTDEHGASSTQLVTITIIGTNDRPVISYTQGNDAGKVVEDDYPLSNEEDLPENPAITVSGQLTSDDPDNGAIANWSILGADSGTYGSIVVDTAGKWTYTLDNTAAQSLADGESKTETYTVRVTDDKGAWDDQLVTITIVGTNDDPVINSKAQNASITEVVDLGSGENTLLHSANGAVTFTDVDTLDTHTATVAPQAGNYLGTLTLDPSDSPNVTDKSVGWTFTVNDALLDSLQAGQTLTQKYDVTVNDGHGGTATQTITITLVGTNDAPVISSAVQGATITEVADLADDENTLLHSTNGAVTFTDVDTLDTHTATVAPQAGNYLGTLTLDPNDSPNVTDKSVGWTFTVNDVLLDSLQAGQTLTQKYDVTVNDGHGGTATQTITITLVGTNDAPVISSAVQGATITEVADLADNENTLLHSANGAVTFTDVDTLDTHTATVAPQAGNYLGTLTLDPNDSPNVTDKSVGWTFTVNDALLDSLQAGQTLTQKYDVTVDDGHGGTTTQTITITLVGTNDKPIISNDPGNAQGGNDVVYEAGLSAGSQAGVAAITATGTFTVGDPDGLGDIKSLTVGGITFHIASGTDTSTDKYVTSLSDLNGKTVSTAHGALHIDSYNAGVFAYTYTLTSTVQNATAADTQFSEVIPLSVTDGINSASTDITVNIIDDVPHAQNDGVATVTEDATGLANSALTSTVSGDVLSNDSAGADQSKAFGAWSSTDTAVVAALNQYGLLTQGSNGTWSYVLNNALTATQALSGTFSQDYVLHYTMKDADGDSSPATLTIHINGTNDGPHISLNQSAVLVSEEGLSNANLDTVLLNDPASSSSDPTDAADNPKTAHGTFSVSDADVGDTLTVTLLTGPTGLTSGSPAQAVQWALSPDGHTLTGYVGSNTTANAVLTITLTQGTAGNWSYDVELLKPINHANNSYEDVRSVSFDIQVSDPSQASSTATLTVNIEDDMPVANTQTVAATIPTVNTNLILTIDVSGSMGSGVGSKMELAKTALMQLIDRYDNLGDVKVMLVTFSGGSSLQGSTTWLDVTTAKSILASLTANGSTNYDSPLQQVIDHFGDAGKFTGSGTQNIAYFLSDGEPNVSGYLTYPSNETGNSSTVGIAGDDITDWQNFVSDNQINSLSFSVGSNVAPATLDPIAYNGILGSNTNAIAVPTINDLPAALLNSVQFTQHTLNLFGLNGGFGADGGHVASLTVDGVTYFFNGSVTGGTSNGTFNNGTWVINTNGTNNSGGTISIDMNTGVAHYNVSPSSSLNEIIAFTLIDNDGDKADGSVTFNLNAPPQIVVNTGNTNNANDVVNESALASGTNPSSNSEFAVGTLTLSDPNGALNTTLASITVGTTTVTLNQIMSSTGYTFSGTNGDLTISNYNSVTGLADYKFVLKSATTDVSNSIESNRFDIKISDGSLESPVQTITIQIVDDAPILAVTNGYIADKTGGVLLGNLVEMGADGGAASGAIIWNSVTSKINGSSASLTSLGEEVTISISGNTVTGKTASNATVFLIVGNTDGSYSMTLNRPIDSSKLFSTDGQLLSYGDSPRDGYYLYQGTGDQFFGFNSGALPDANKTLLATFTGTGGSGGNLNKINTSTSGIGVGGNTMDSGDTLQIDLNNNAKFSAVKISVDNYIGGEGEYFVRYTDGTTSNAWIPLVVSGSNQDAFIQAPSGKFIDSIDIAHTGHGNQFKIDGMNFFQLDTGRIPTLDLGFTAKDGDGDTVSGTVKITLDLSGSVSSGNNNPSALGGSDDVDTLAGGNGNDILSGGKGNDILNGGDGSDLFVFSTVSNNGKDTIQDFTVAAKASGGDVLDITDLLSGAGVSTASFDANEGAFLQFTAGANSGEIKVMFDADGAGAGSAVQVATLTGMGATDPTTLLNTLLNNGEIQTNH
ncbi:MULTISPECIES: retention module-containing protein [Deefgea]|nr:MULTISPECIES: retention module-containing protein [Deefgea]MBM9889984.1 retention module-containing protein [Deefgea sp. CFH1-16]